MNKKPIVAFGEVLWDLLPAGAQLGGAPFNFCYRAHSLGMNGTMISRLGRDELGTRAHQRIIELGVSDGCIQWDDKHPTGAVDIQFDEANQPDYEIIANVAYDFIEAVEAALHAAKDADCICFGSLAQRNPVSRHTLQQLLAHASNAIKLFDVNLRTDCYSTEVISNSLDQSQIVKLNDDEALMIRDLFGFDADTLPEVADAMMKRWPLQLCLITMGDKGVLAKSQTEPLYEPGFEIDVVDPCGSGDAFTAAFMAKWLNQAPLNECCLWGNALGAMVASTSGATVPILVSDIESFLKNPPKRIGDESQIRENAC